MFCAKAFTDFERFAIRDFTDSLSSHTQCRASLFDFAPRGPFFGWHIIRGAMVSLSFKQRPFRLGELGLGATELGN